MLMLKVLPLVAYAGVTIVVLMIAMGRYASPFLRVAVPSAIGAAFLAFSLVTLMQDGLMQFWVNHSSDFAGNQVWFDLLFAVAISFYLIAPRARAVGMRLLPWAIAVIMTACVALLPMLARLLWLEQRLHSLETA